jgi:hypothetical protein
VAWAANRRPASQVVVLVNPPTDDHCIYSNTIHNTVPPPQLVAWVTAAATTITTTATTTAAAPPPPPSLLLQRHHPSSSVDPLWDPENHPFSAKKCLLRLNTPRRHFLRSFAVSAPVFGQIARLFSRARDLQSYGGLLRPPGGCHWFKGDSCFAATAGTNSPMPGRRFPRFWCPSHGPFR